jgi:hypothetical protein
MSGSSYRLADFGMAYPVAGAYSVRWIVPDLGDRGAGLLRLFPWALSCVEASPDGRVCHGVGLLI